MRFRARALTEWVWEPSGRRVLYPVAAGLPVGVRVRDVTGRRSQAIGPEVNSVVVELDGHEEALDALATDPRIIELWREARP